MSFILHYVNSEIFFRILIVLFYYNIYENIFRFFKIDNPSYINYLPFCYNIKHIIILFIFMS